MNFDNNSDISNIFKLPLNEEFILKKWKETNVLEELKKCPNRKENWNFLDGPPFVNGNPHHGHLLVSTIKDVLARYKSNRGKKVSYQIGFDCHGLPMEQAAEKEIGKKINSDANIEEIAIFNKKCQEIQDRCSDRFETVLTRLGRQFESDKTYYTSDINYMNALWISFRQLFDKGLIYRGKKVMPYSYGCQTALSNFEANQNYQSVSHTSLYLKFKISNRDNEFFLVWTTTPWSLLANQALCLNPKLEYVLVESQENYWIAKDLYPSLFKKSEKIIKTVLGKDLINISYNPVFNYFNQDNFKTLNDEYVTSQSGTGIVHLAPLFGADDFRVCMENKIIDNQASDLPNFLDGEAKITKNISLDEKVLIGNNILEMSDDVINNLKSRQLYFKKESIVHKYPYCWRTDTPLIYLAQDCWFLNVQMIKDDMIKNNSKIQWFPEFVGAQRFNNWLEGAPDWCLSRNRFWGTPIPIWKSDDDDYICIESKEDLQKYSDKLIDNLHREYIDNIVIIKDGKKYKRIDAVFDCWYESGMAGIAKEGDNCREASYPVDFIAESLDQTRGWFYTLNVLSTALYNKPAFKKVIVSGLILASDGMKMSKRLNNYTPPDEILKTYGADVLRLYLLSSPATQAQEFRFVDSELVTFTKKLLPYFHAHKMLYECFKNMKVEKSVDIAKLSNSNFVSNDKFDNWIINMTNKLQIDIDNHVKKLELYKIPDSIFSYMDSLTNVWVKFSRDRLKNNNTLEDTVNSINTLYSVLTKVNIVLSPFMPFNTDLLYHYIKWISRHNTDSINFESIHLLITNDVETYDSNVIESLDNVYNIIEIIRSARQDMKEQFNRPTNSPIRTAEIYLPNIYKDKIDPYFNKYIQEQCNIENVIYYHNVECNIEPNKGSIGKMFKRNGKDVIKLINTSSLEDILSGKIFYQYNGNNILIDSKYYKLSSISIEKENYYTIKSGIYLILLDKTLDEDLTYKMKLSLWKREIQELRKKLNYQFWDKLELVIDENSIDDKEKLDYWLKHFESLLNSKIRISNNLENNLYTFNFENESINYNLNKYS